MYKYGIACMLMLLVAILAVQYYILEGFDDVPPAPVGIAAPANGMASVAPVAPMAADQSAMTIPVPDMPADDANSSTTAAPVAAAKQEMAKMLKDFQQVAKSKVTSERMMTPIAGDAAAPATPALQQGNEYDTAGCPDMSQYIRKDAIPCWNCTLDF
jgi:hypothetical protein